MASVVQNIDLKIQAIGELIIFKNIDGDIERQIMVRNTDNAMISSNIIKEQLNNAKHVHGFSSGVMVDINTPVMSYEPEPLNIKGESTEVVFKYKDLNVSVQEYDVYVELWLEEYPQEVDTLEE